MPRVPYVEKETANADVKKLYEGFETQFGMPRVPNVVKALANSPGLATKVFPLANYFMNQSPLDKRTRELAVLMLMKRRPEPDDGEAGGWSLVEGDDSGVGDGGGLSLGGGVPVAPLSGGNPFSTSVAFRLESPISWACSPR